MMPLRRRAVAGLAWSDAGDHGGVMSAGDKAQGAHGHWFDRELVVDDEGNVSEADPGPSLEESVRWDL